MKSKRSFNLIALIIIGVIGFTIFKHFERQRIADVEVIEQLCINAGTLSYGLKDAITDFELANGDQFLGLIPDTMDGRTIHELIREMDQLCYKLGKQYL